MDKLASFVIQGERILPEKKVEERTDKISPQSLAVLILILVLCLNFWIIHAIRGLKAKHPRLGRYLQGPPISLLLGFVIGLIVYFVGFVDAANALRESFTPLFMTVFLPFIIIDGAVNNIPTESFFRNIGKISIFAILGTTISIGVTGLLMMLASHSGISEIKLDTQDAFIFSSIISATDPVSILSVFKEIDISSMLYSIVFGESILNDVIGYTSFDMLMNSKILGPEKSKNNAKFVVIFTFSSIITGYSIGLITSFICKFIGSNTLERIAESGEVQEEADNFYSLDFVVMFLSPWISYLFASSVGLSGIISIFFCGIALGQFAVFNLSKSCRKFTEKAYGAISEICESVCFIYIGISFFGFNHTFTEVKIPLLLYVIFTILFARALNVVVCSYCIQLVTNEKPQKSHQIVTWFSGLRGAMAFTLGLEALSKHPNKKVGGLIYFNVLVVTALTILIKSPFIEPILQYLGVVEDPNEKLQEITRGGNRGGFSGQLGQVMRTIFLSEEANRTNAHLEEGSLSIRHTTENEISGLNGKHLNQSLTKEIDLQELPTDPKELSETEHDLQA